MVYKAITDREGETERGGKKPNKLSTVERGG